MQRPLPQQSGSGLRIGVVRDPFWNDIDHETADVCQRALKLAGWKVTEVKIENIELAVAAFLGRLIAEAGVPSPDVLATISAPTRALLLAGMLTPARFVPRADRVRAAVRYSLAAAFETVDFLAWPDDAGSGAHARGHVGRHYPRDAIPVDVPNVRQASLPTSLVCPASRSPLV